MERIDILLEVSKQALFSRHIFTTSQIADRLKVSQQSASNALRRLEDEGLINRDATNSGIYVMVTEHGRKFLNKYKKHLDHLLSPKNVVAGRVFSGVGEGSFYTELPGYKRQFIKKLSIKPFPGTLNLKLSIGEKTRFLFNKEPIVIKGFSRKDRSFGWIRCYPVMIGEIKAAITVPERTIHKSTLELISAINLRKKFKLSDNDEVKIEWQ